MKKSDLLLPLTSFVAAVFMIGLISGGFLVVQIDHTLPDAQSIKSVELKIPLRVYSADGLLISEFGNERRKPTSIEAVPQSLINSVLASEDDNFYHHRGIDVRGLIRSTISNIRSGGKGQGASTITMQVARNFFLTPEKTYIRKVKEILLSIKLEQILTKDEILSLYLNKIFLGHRSYGFGAAAEVYYGKELEELSLAESAMLAGLPKAPSTTNPLRNPTRAMRRRNYVLDRLKQLGKISDEQYKEASEAPITAVKHTKTSELSAPYIAEMVRASVIEQYGEQAYWKGLSVHTTIVSSRQIDADRSLRSGLQAYDKRHGFRGPITKFEQAKLESLDTKELAKLVAEFPNSREQVPALVLQVNEAQALLLTKHQTEITITLEGAAWARRFLSSNSTADKPSEMTQLVSAGDLIYIEPLKVSNSPNETSENGAPPINWRLSQIPNISGAIISMEPSSGKIFALTGGYDFFLNKYNRAIQSVRQPGSNIKPFIYSASLDKGISPTSRISGAPIVITDPAHGTVWRPENYSGKFFGPTRMREALSKSLNLVSIRLLRSIGIPYSREYVSRFGIDMDRFSPTLTMALGAGGVTPLEMLGAYAALANTGYRVEPYFIDHISNRDGDIIYQAKQAVFCDECFAQFIPIIPEPESLDEPADGTSTVSAKEIDDGSLTIPEDSSLAAEDSSLAAEGSSLAAEGSSLAAEGSLPNADGSLEPASVDPFAPVQQQTYQAPRIMRASNNFLTVSMLKDVIRYGTGRKALVLDRGDLAGKTGTTNDYIDAWFTGFNSKVATTVWVGFDDPATLGRGEAGGVAALPIWIDYMRTALEDVAEDNDEVPDYIEEVSVDKVTGEPSDELDPGATPEYFPIESMLPELEKQFLYAVNYSAPNSSSDNQIEESVIEGNTEEEALEETLKDASLEQDQEYDQHAEPRILEQEEDTEGLF